MKKNLKNIICTALIPVLAASSFVGCGGGDTSSNDEGFKYTGNETTLKIGIFNGGLGYSWLEKVGREFEKDFANVSFENGKMGVRIVPHPDKVSFRADLVQSAIEQNVNADDIYYLAIYTGPEYIYKGYAADITSAVVDKVYLDNGELADMEWDAEQGKLVAKAGATAPTKSIADKMVDTNRVGYYYSENELDFNKDGTADYNPGYYSLPFENSLSGFIYDYDLFSEMGWLDYDGIDGLPDTMDDFFDLLDRIVAADMIPYTFSKGVSNYWPGLYDAFIAQYEGLDAAELNFTYDGEYTFDATTSAQIKADYPDVENEEYLTVNADGTYTVEIDSKNAWLLAYQPSKSELMKFLRKLADPKYFDPDIYKETHNYTAAQDQFVLSKLGKNKQKRIAMMYEGEWWENETRANFNYTGGYGKREFRFFPLPYIEGQKDEDVRSVCDYSRGVDLFVNAKTKKLDLCKLWLQYAHSESALETFTMETGVTRFYDYDLDEEQLKTLTPFGRNTYKIKMTNETGVTVFASRAWIDPNDFYRDTPMGGFSAYIGTTAYYEWGGSSPYSPIQWMVEHAGVEGQGVYIGIDTIVNGITDYYTKANWEQAYNAWESLQ